MNLYSAKAVARFLDLSERRVRQLRDEKVISEYRPGLYDLESAVRDYINYLRKGNSGAGEVINYNTERARLVRVKRENLELDLQIRKGELHNSADVETVLTDALIKFKNKLMMIPAKLSPVLSKKKNEIEVFDALKAAVDEALSELSKFDEWHEKGEAGEDEKSDT